MNTSHQLSPDDSSPQDEHSIKRVIAQFTEDFVRSYLPEHVEHVQNLWEVLEPLPLETLQHDVGKAGVAATLGLASQSLNLLALISVMSWLVVTALDPNQKEPLSQDAIVQAGYERGCSLALSQYVALYWKTHSSL